jgi:hypothetical protein
LNDGSAPGIEWVENECVVVICFHKGKGLSSDVWMCVSQTVSSKPGSSSPRGATAVLR